MSEPTDKWSEPGSGAHYAGPRFTGQRAAGRDPRTVARLLQRHGVRGRLLDAPCGTGRLSESLSRFSVPVVSLDLSPSMLSELRTGVDHAVLRASIAALPFCDRSFDVVVSCRFLHHLHTQSERAHAVGELLRVSKRLLVASFWDSACWPALRVRLGLRRSEGARGRVAFSRAELEQHVAAGGGRVLEYATGVRFLTQQTFFVAERVT